MDEYKKGHSKSVIAINKCFNKVENMEEIANRFIFKGINIDNSLVDIILWGPPNDFIWITRDETIKYLKSSVEVDSSSIHFGRLAIQPSNRCLNRNSKQEYHRKQVAAKWYNIFDSMIMIINERVLNTTHNS